MDCAISLFSGNYWMGILTWVAFAAVATFAVTFLFAGRSGSRAAAVSSPPELERLTARIDEISRRLEDVEKTVRGK